MNSEALHLVIGHSINTLPDSLRERIVLLHALHQMTPPNHPLRERIHVLCVEIEAHIQKQLRLALDFKSNAPQPNPKGKSK